MRLILDFDKDICQPVEGCRHEETLKALKKLKEDGHKAVLMTVTQKHSKLEALDKGKWCLKDQINVKEDRGMKTIRNILDEYAKRLYNDRRDYEIATSWAEKEIKYLAGYQEILDIVRRESKCDSDSCEVCPGISSAIKKYIRGL